MAGTVEPYATAQGRRWMVRYRKPAPHKGQTKKRGFRTKRDAELYLATITTAKASGDYVDPARGRVTVGSLSTDWLRRKKALKPSSYHSLEVSWRVHVEPKWGDTLVSAIETTAVEHWLQDMAEGISPSARKRTTRKTGTPLSATVSLRALGVLAGILDDAVQDRRIRKNPARGARNLPRKVAKLDRRYLTHEEVGQLAAGARDITHTTLILVLAYTGLRWGEAIGLRVRDVNFLRRRVHVRVNAVEVDGEIHVGMPKNWERRAVPFPAFLDDALTQLTKGKAKDALVFGNDLGGHLLRPRTSDDSGSWFVAAIRAAGIERLTLHDLRHTAASLAISAGANVKAVQRMLGHKSAAMTLDTYADLFEDDLDDVAVRMDERGRAVALAALEAARSAA